MSRCLGKRWPKRKIGRNEKRKRKERIQQKNELKEEKESFVESWKQKSRREQAFFIIDWLREFWVFKGGKELVKMFLIDGHQSLKLNQDFWIEPVNSLVLRPPKEKGKVWCKYYICFPGYISERDREADACRLIEVMYGEKIQNGDEMLVNLALLFVGLRGDLWTNIRNALSTVTMEEEDRTDWVEYCDSNVVYQNKTKKVKGEEAAWESLFSICLSHSP